MLGMVHGQVARWGPQQNLKKPDEAYANGELGCERLAVRGEAHDDRGICQCAARRCGR